MLLWAQWQEDWLLYHKVTFDGILKRIYVNPDVSQLNVKTDIYSSWKEWTKLRDNSKYLAAFRTTGGDPVGGGLYAGDIYFLINDWQIYIDHNVRATGIIYHDNPLLDPFVVLPGGGITSVVSNLAYAYDQGGGAATPAEVAAEVWNANLAQYGNVGSAGKTVSTIKETTDTTLAVSV